MAKIIKTRVNGTDTAVVTFTSDHPDPRPGTNQGTTT